MKEKQKLTTNPDILITGRHIEFVTGYSLEECRNQLKRIEKSGWFIHERIKVQTNNFNYKIASFEIKRIVGGGNNKSVKKIKGSIRPQRDGTLLVQAEVPLPHGTIAFRIGILAVFALLSFGYPLMWGFIALIPVVLFLGYTDDKSDTKRMQKLLRETLYTPIDLLKREYHE